MSFYIPSRDDLLVSEFYAAVFETGDILLDNSVVEIEVTCVDVCDGTKKATSEKSYQYILWSYDVLILKLMCECRACLLS